MPIVESKIGRLVNISLIKAVNVNDDEFLFIHRDNRHELERVKGIIEFCNKRKNHIDKFRNKLFLRKYFANLKYYTERETTPDELEDYKDAQKILEKWLKDNHARFESIRRKNIKDYIPF